MWHDLTEHFRALIEIHAAPQWLWPALVHGMVGVPATESKPWTVEQTRRFGQALDQRILKCRGRAHALAKCHGANTTRSR